MELNAALERLIEECKKLEKIEDIDQKTQNELFSLLKPAIHDYLYIATRTSSKDVIYLKAQKEFLNISKANPSFKAVIDSMIKLPQENETDNSDRNSLLKMINDLYREFKLNYQSGFNGTDFGDFEFRLRKCHKLLINNQTKLSPDEFIKSIHIIELIIGQVERHNSMINTESSLNRKGYTFVWLLAIFSIFVSIGIIILGTLLR